MINAIDQNFRAMPLQNPSPKALGKKIVKQIKKIACRIFNSLKDGLLFSSRYLGSKKNALKGLYLFSSEKRLIPSEAKVFLPYAFANACANNGAFGPIKKLGYSPIDPQKISPHAIHEMSKHDHYFFDPKSGLKAILFENGNDVIISFGALDSSKNVASDLEHYQKIKQRGIKSGIYNLLGGNPARYEQATSFVKALAETEKLKEKQITLAGNCIGGSVAAYVALKLNIKAVCFNPLALGAGLQQKIGDKNLINAKKTITNISTKCDWASDFMPFKKIDVVLNFIGLRTPGIFGHRYTIPTSFGWNLRQIHTKVLAALKSYTQT